MKVVYVVAVSQVEANGLAELIGWNARVDANSHLKRVKAAPTDPYYAAQYKVFTVEVPA